MAWTVRSLDELSSRARGYFRQYMPGTDTSLKNNFVTATTKVLAGISHEFELRMAYLAKQLFISTATGQFLVRQCADIGIYRKQAARASGSISGLATPLTTLPAGIRFASGAQIYTSTAPSTSGAGGELVLTVSSDLAGENGNREVDGAMTLADPLLFPSLSANWLVGEGGIGGGADVENDESLRVRGLQRKRNPPGAGTLSDYERITLAVPGVSASWAFRGSSPGSIFVYFLFAGRSNSIPTVSDVAVIQAAIDAQRLIRVDDSVAVAPVARPINVTINGLSGDTPEIRASIEAAISAMFVARCRPGISGNTFTVSISWIDEVISGVAGEDRHVLVAPVADVILTNGQFPTLGVVTYGA
jgi:uncharacterized phage protein gp47/JayE